MPPPRYIQQGKKEQFRGVMPPPRYIQQEKKVIPRDYATTSLYSTSKKNNSEGL